MSKCRIFVDLVITYNNLLYFIKCLNIEMFRDRVETVSVINLFFIILNDSSLFKGPPILLFCTSGDDCPGFSKLVWIPYL